MTAERILTQADAIRTRQVLEHARRIGLAPDLAGAARAAAAAVIELAGCDRARVLFYDDESGTLWSELGDGDDAHASDGVAGLAVRTRSGVVLPRAADEARYRAAIDDPQGHGAERLAAQPIADPDGRVHGVAIAIRSADRPPFGEPELRALAALADAWAPFLHQLAQKQEAERVLEGARAQRDDDLFRREALEHFLRRGHRGDVVRVHPGWVHAAYWIVVVFVLGGVGYAAVAQVHKWSQGAAVVRVTGRTDVTTYEGGTITALAVAPDQSVMAGQELARLHDAEQAAILRAQNTEFERKLVAYLQTPGDPVVKQALAALVAARDSARARSEARVIRAPHDGVVKSVHVAPGQRVEAGRTILSLVEPGAEEGMSVYAFLPQSDTSQIDVGQRMRFAIPGYRGASLELAVAAVSEPMGAGDARDRYLGDRFRDGVALAGQVVVVEARLADPSFTAGGRAYQLHDGMIGVAEVQLESRSVLEALVPGP
ncbi:MAG TPA: HlyD family efflux transporter periplasmic adaptor subunit [Kofleriaceae bacterium]|nr:HlyD family efflux transporter periplasmic adaptor subunit [Kofleriaceae bacterium]